MDRSVVLSVWLAVSLALPSSADDSIEQLPSLDRYSDKALISFYTTLAFGSEYAGIVPALETERVVKRDQDRPARIVPIPQPSAEVEETLTAVERVTKALSDRSGGLELVMMFPDELKRVVDRGKNYFATVALDSVLVYIGDRPELLSSLAKGASSLPILAILRQSIEADNTKPICLSISTAKDVEKGLIGAALVFVETGEAFTACLYEEIMQSFGIANDFPEGTPSIFNDDGAHSVPTDLDWLLWRIHTDESLAGGMSKADVRRLLPAIIENLRR